MLISVASLHYIAEPSSEGAGVGLVTTDGDDCTRVGLNDVPTLGDIRVGYRVKIRRTVAKVCVLDGRIAHLSCLLSGG